MKWQRITQRLGELNTEQGSDEDPFQHLLHPVESNNVEVRATMGRSEHVTMGAGHEGWLKCDVSVVVRCPQKEALIDIAGELAAKKALELTNDGMSLFGLPRIGDES